MLDVAFADWLNLGFRWLHVIAGISWIGTSFYFIFLDLSLRKHANLPDGVGGEAWNVHGGGFYLMRKYTVAPAELPRELHWFKYEAYFTWLSGFALLAVIYYWGAESYLIDKNVLNLETWEAILISVGFFAGGWVIYDLLCRSPFSSHETLLSAAVFILIAFSAYFLTHLFSGRAAFVHVGAMVGTIMVGNVFFIIIPNQKKIVKSLLAGNEPDPRLGAMGKHRSTHNNYLTLPVILMMISQHYPMLYDNDNSWLVVTLILLVGASIRHFFNLMHTGRPISSLRWQWPTAAVLMAILVVYLSWKPETDPYAEVKVPSAAEAVAISQARCASCHATKTTDPDVEKAPGGVMLETTADLRKHSSGILKQSVFSKAMPLGNKTKMTDAERKALGAWIRAGMPEGDK
ncbi:MAG: urate hydroxylase PuuD [Pseudomonadota bacterium]|nr:urate hydroxylase PuuD [Pseudomonadota bacterium]